MASESDIAERYIYSLLNANATISSIAGGRIYSDVAPQGAAYPFIVMSLLSGIDVAAVGAQRIGSSMQYLIKAVDRTGSYGGNLGALADAIDAALDNRQGSSGPATGGYAIACYRLQPWQQTQIDAGVMYKSRGGIYRIFTQVT